MDYAGQWREKITATLELILGQFAPTDPLTVEFDFKNTTSGAGIHGFYNLPAVSNDVARANARDQLAEFLLERGRGLDPKHTQLDIMPRRAPIVH